MMMNEHLIYIHLSGTKFCILGTEKGHSFETPGTHGALDVSRGNCGALTQFHTPSPDNETYIAGGMPCSHHDSFGMNMYSIYHYFSGMNLMKL